ncbi:Synaptogyrin-2 [Taenia solium]|eukprot:TsM_000321900 transcript=TsM_000321900 gene=TsM_000321900
MVSRKMAPNPVYGMDVVSDRVEIISVIGLGCATNGCTMDEYFIFNNDANACRFAVAVTLLGFLFSLISLASDYMYDKTANIKRRRYILISDIGGAGLFALLNFVAFCYLANRWSNTESTWLEERGFEQWQRRNARSVIFFAFVALVAWSGLTFMALLRFRASGQGHLSNGFAPSPPMEPGTGSSAGVDDMYPPPPASAGPTPPHQQQPMGGGGGVGAVSQPTYYPPPTF